MKNTTHWLFTAFVLAAATMGVLAETNISFPPVPAEDRQKGKNDNAYLCAIGHPTEEEKQAFLSEAKEGAVKLSRLHGVPASALAGMAVNESCYGYTRTGLFANNYFGMKKWTRSSDDSYQITGQPDEDSGKVRVLEVLPSGQKIFDEKPRRDNRYWKFNSKGDAMQYLVEEFLMKKKSYRLVIQKYQDRIKTGTLAKEASREFLCELAAAGYNHLGCNYYRKTVGAVIDTLGLDQLDK